VILVDTSAWVEFFRGRGELALRVDELLLEDEVALCGPILTELRRGLRSPQERKKVLPLLAGCHTLDSPSDVWSEAGDLGYYLARRGCSASTLDLLIAVHSLAHSVPLLTRDSDFSSMRKAGVPLVLAR
jgi:predicted nucleic acid-binding protein